MGKAFKRKTIVMHLLRQDVSLHWSGISCSCSSGCLSFLQRSDLKPARARMKESQYRDFHPHLLGNARVYQIYRYMCCHTREIYPQRLSKHISCHSRQAVIPTLLFQPKNVIQSEKKREPYSTSVVLSSFVSGPWNSIINNARRRNHSLVKLLSSHFRNPHRYCI